MSPRKWKSLAFELWIFLASAVILASYGHLMYKIGESEGKNDSRAKLAGYEEQLDSLYRLGKIYNQWDEIGVNRYLSGIEERKRRDSAADYRETYGLLRKWDSMDRNNNMANVGKDKEKDTSNGHIGDSVSEGGK